MGIIYPKGSEWRKWDLHIHTPYSIVQHFGDADNDEIWDKYIEDLEKLPPEFKVLGINDYLFIDGYERLLKEKTDNDRLPNIDLLLPVVEFRIDKFAGVDFGPFKRINLHVIFSEQLSPGTIQSQFLSTLAASFSLEAGVNSSSWSGVIDRESISLLGKNIKDSIPSDQREKFGSDLVEGFNNLNLAS